jgi:hypothetical protein
MNKKFTVLVLLAATWVIFLPAESAAYSSGEKSNSISIIAGENLVLQQGRGRGRGGRYDRYWEQRGRRRNGTWYGYRNYGQYRRTQVGNRRYRNVRSYVWRDGRRVSIWRRIFY